MAGRSVCARGGGPPSATLPFSLRVLAVGELGTVEGGADGTAGGAGKCTGMGTGCEKVGFLP